MSSRRAAINLANTSGEINFSAGRFDKTLLHIFDKHLVKQPLVSRRHL